MSQVKDNIETLAFYKDMLKRLKKIDKDAKAIRHYFKTANQ